IVEFRKTIRLMPGETTARLYVGRITLLQGRGHEAVDVFKEAIHLRPDDAAAQTMLGYALTATGQLDEAADAFRTALGLRSDSWQIHMGLGTLLLRRGRWQEGAEEYERARVNSSRSGDDGRLYGHPGHRLGIDNTAVWYFCAVAQLRAGRIGRYRWLCGELL